MLCIAGLALVLISIIAVMSLRPPRHTVAVPNDPSFAQFTAPPPPAQPEKQLRRELFLALGYGAPTPWRQRLDFLRNLPADLSAAELDAMLTAMMKLRPPDESPGTYTTYIHEIACRLQKNDKIRAPFARALATLARDTRCDPDTRDYVAQHLRQVWSRAQQDPDLRTSIFNTFSELTRLDPAIATPALLGLHLLGTVDDSAAAMKAQPNAKPADPSETRNLSNSFEIPDAKLTDLIEPILTAKTSAQNIPARLTAFRIVGERRMHAYRPLLFVVLKDQSEHALVRMAAANAIGNIAADADLKTLASLPIEDFRVVGAVKHALQRHAIR